VTTPTLATAPMAAYAPLVVVPCSGRKRSADPAATSPRPATGSLASISSSTWPARELYVGSYFRACLAAALAITPAQRVRILSAKHGLLTLEEPVAPYELRMGDPGAVTPADVAVQAQAQGLCSGEPVLVLAGRAYASVAARVWPHAVDALAGTRGIGEQLARLAAFRTEPQRAHALLLTSPSAPAPTRQAEPAQAVALDAAPPHLPAAELPTWRYVADPATLLAHAVPTNGPSARTGGAARTVCGRRLAFTKPSKARAGGPGAPPQEMAPLDPQPWPSCRPCQRAMPAGAFELEQARHAEWEADQLAHDVDALEADDEALLVAGELWEVGDVVTFCPPASADKPTLGAAGRVEVLEVLDEDERFLYGSQYAVRHLRSSRIAYATDDELFDVLADSPTAAPSRTPAEAAAAELAAERALVAAWPAGAESQAPAGACVHWRTGPCRDCAWARELDAAAARGERLPLFPPADWAPAVR
jgi:hypothetical protein